MTEQHTDRRSRGRPLGSGKDDSATLTAVADLIVASEGGAQAISPSSAMKRCVKGIGDSDLRRLQVKWKSHGGSLKEEARERVRARSEARATAKWVAPGVGAGHSTYAAGLAAVAGMSHYAPLSAASTVQCMLAATKLMEDQFGAGGIAGFIARDAAMRETYSKMMGSSGLLTTIQHSAAAAAILGTPLSWSASISEVVKSMGMLDQVGRMAESPTMRAARELGETFDRADPMRRLR